MDAQAWERPDPGEVRVLGSQADWDALLAEYEQLLGDGAPGRAMGPHMVPFQRCLEVARSAGASSVVIETRYLDLDYRSEYSAYYSRGFRHLPASARRLHFFRAPLRPEQLWEIPDDAGYVGYMVVRPVPLGPVGRTMLLPPPGMENAVRTAVEEGVTLFGQAFGVKAVPFMQQDAQLDRCAHAAAWVCHYTAYRQNLVSRRSMAAFSMMADQSLGYGRAVPSEGLTVQQLLQLFRQFDLPCAFYDIESLPAIPPGPGTPPNPTPTLDASGRQLPAGTWDSRIISIASRYLNSRIPVLVGNQTSEAHAWVLCGYERQTRTGQADMIRFVRHDDQRGPYLWVNDVLADAAPDGYQYTPWRFLVVPLPEKVWLSPEPAEQTAVELLPAMAQAIVAAVPDAQVLLDLIAKDALRWRTYAAQANDFKAGLRGRVDPILLREYRMARFSRFVWVVEAVDRDARRAGRDEVVVGEAVFDGTSNGLRPSALALHVPGLAVVYTSEDGIRGPLRVGANPYRSGGSGPP